MDTALRKVGLTPIPELPWGTHLCLFYDSLDDLPGILASFFKAGLENNERCLVVVPPAIGVEPIRRAMRAVVPEFDPYAARGAVEFVDSENIYGRVGAFDRSKTIGLIREKVAEARAAGYDGLRACGDESWLRSRDWKEFCEYEAELDRLTHGELLLILCAYPLDKRSAADVLAVARSHDFVLARQDQHWHVLEPAPVDGSRLALQAQRAGLERRVLELTRELESESAKRAEETAERGRLERELRASDARFSTSIEATPLMVAVTRLVDGRTVEVNEAFLKKLGCQKHEVVGRTVEELDLWADHEQCKQAMRELAAAGRLDGFELKANLKDGRTLDLVLYAQPIDAYGQRCVLYTWFDQTARKRAERDLTQQEWLLNESERLSGTGSWEWADRKVVWSPELYRLHGRSPDTFTPSFDAWLEVVHPEDRAPVRQAVEAAMRDNGSYSIEHRIVRPDGEIRILRSVGYSAREDGGAQRRVVGYSTDITQLRETMDKLRAASRKLVDLQEASQQRLATEIHDRVGQLLTALSINLEMMRSSVASDAKAEQRLDDSVRLLNDATGSVVDILSELRPSMVEEVGLVAALRQHMNAFSKRTGLELILDADDARISVPREWALPLYRIVEEGLTNIAKHAQAHSASVKLSQKGGKLTLAIEDNGIGIESGAPRTSASSGLGLVTIRERVEALGGHFHIGPRNGGGTRMEIELRKAEASQAS